MEAATNVFNTVVATVCGENTMPTLKEKGVKYTMGTTNYVEVDDGTDCATEKTDATVQTVVTNFAVADAVAQQKADKPVSKAVIVRSMVSVAKANSITQEVVVEQVIAALGMKKALAKVYVKENWERV